MAPSWSSKLAEMSAEELEHATNLYKMFQEYYSKISNEYSEMPDYCKEAYDSINDEYTKCSVEIKMLHNIFKE